MSTGVHTRKDERPLRAATVAPRPGARERTNSPLANDSSLLFR